MEKNLLIAGKEVPLGNDFASGAASKQRKIIITKTHNSSDSDDSEMVPSGITTVVWNRPSALSSRNLLLKCLNEFTYLDECVLIFDETYFVSKYGSMVNTSENIKIIEELIASYQYLTMEIVARVQKINANAAEKHPTRLIFLFKPNTSLSESIVSMTGRTSSTISSPLISAAAGAFKSYAENTAATLYESEDIHPLLVMSEPGNEYTPKDAALASWLFEYIDSLDSLKRPLTPKQKLSWIKAGSRTPGGFGGFFS